MVCDSLAQGPDGKTVRSNSSMKRLLISKLRAQQRKLQVDFRRIDRLVPRHAAKTFADDQIGRSQKVLAIQILLVNTFPLAIAIRRPWPKRRPAASRKAVERQSNSLQNTPEKEAAAIKQNKRTSRITSAPPPTRNGTQRLQPFEGFLRSACRLCHQACAREGSRSRSNQSWKCRRRSGAYGHPLGRGRDR